MSPKITESAIESLAIELLEKLGYTHLYGTDIAPDGAYPERSSFEDVVLVARVQDAVARINPGVPLEAREDAVKQVLRLNSPNLLANNEAFHRMLTEGVRVSYQKNGDIRGDLVWLIDERNLDNNDFLAVNQFTVVENDLHKRLDMVLFINGLPLVVFELKNPAQENATVRSAFQQIQTYKAMIPRLFAYNGFIVLSDGLEARAGTISSDFSRFMAWKTVGASPLSSQLETLIHGMLRKSTILDILQHFILFEKAKREDKGIITIETVKKLAAYHQYYAVNRAVESTMRAAGYGGLVMEEPEQYGLSSTFTQPPGDRKGGVVWHTQGSGKSLSMVFYVGKIVLAMDNPTIVMITDRNDLDDQLFDTFASAKQLLRQEPIQAENREHLKELLKVGSGGIVFTTIQKFLPEDGNVYERLSERKNIIVIADEAHRTQYGLKAKTKEVKDEKGNLIGEKTIYGFAKYMRDALPNATYLGFTGTPIESDDVNTRTVFGNYVDIYDISKAVEDGATVRIYYESRLARIELDEEGRKLVQEMDDELEQEEESEKEKAKSKWTRLEALIGSEKRIQQVAQDIVTHFEQRQEVFSGKGMIVTMSRRIAADLYGEIIRIRPEWHSDDLRKGKIKVVMTSASSDGVKISKHHTTKEQRRVLNERMKNPEGELQLVVVRDMWLTGFDVPWLHTMYLDKPMKGHNLMQAIARVNRVYKDKPGGLVVDYLGIAADLKKALSFYTDNGGKGDPAIAQEKAVQIMQEKLEVVSQMFYGFDYKKYFEANTGRKLSLILEAEEHILALERGKKRFLDEVTALSQAFSLAIPQEQALHAREEVAFFQAVKARLAKFAKTDSDNTNEDMETVIRQVIDKALVTEQVIDIFDAAGIKKPDISILSEDFLLEVQNMKHKNLAMEVLKKLLKDEIKARIKKNLVQGKSLMEMLENSIQKYHARILTAAQVIEELIHLGKEIKDMDKEPKEMGLSDYEYAFYTAIANNDSAIQVMKKEKLRELAVVLFNKVRENASIDWTIKESVKAKLKVIVKRILRQYGYPPDMQMLATETVLKQAELIAQEMNR